MPLPVRCIPISPRRILDLPGSALRVEPFSPLARSDACRLLGSAHHALGARAAACAAAERAAAEAARGQVVWLEMLSLRDLLSWCEASEREGVQARAQGVASRLVASREELVAVLGEGLL